MRRAVIVRRQTIIHEMLGALEHASTQKPAATFFLQAAINLLMGREIVTETSNLRKDDSPFRAAPALLQPWRSITTFAGGEAELDKFHDRRGDRSDLIAIANMMQRLHLAWTEHKLTDLRRQAHRLVEREGHGIWTVADALIRHRHPTAFDVRWLRACSPLSRRFAAA